MLSILQHEGFSVTVHGLKKIRFALGLRRKNNDESAQDEINRVRNYLHIDKFTTNRVRNMGRRMFYTHLITQKFNITQTRAWQLYAEYHQQEIDLRSSLAKRRRHGWTVPGPNYTWSVDGYAKLAVYGFEVYAAVDAYSRYIPWFFIGHSAFTALGVVLQFLTVVAQTGIMPRIFRSDRGGETSLLARAHYFLSMASRPRVDLPRQETISITPLRVRTVLQELVQESTPPIHIDQDQPLPFSLCWSYSKSIYNVKIERWWGELCSGRTEFWRVCFFFFFFLLIICYFYWLFRDLFRSTSIARDVFRYEPSWSDCNFIYLYATYPGRLYRIRTPLERISYPLPAEQTVCYPRCTNRAVQVFIFAFYARLCMPCWYRSTTWFTGYVRTRRVRYGCILTVGDYASLLYVY